MSEPQNNTAAPVEATPTATSAPIDAPAVAERVLDAPVVDGEASKVDATAESTTAPTETAPVLTEPVAEKVIEPITEGQLAYKGPGLVK